MKNKYRIGINDDNGEVGLRPLAIPDGDFLQGFTIAHDTLEHCRLDPSAENEFMALGAAYYVRYISGYRAGYGKPAIQMNDPLRLSGFLPDILREMEKAAMGLRGVKTRPVDDSSFEDWATEVIIQGIREHINDDYPGDFDSLYVLVQQNSLGWIRKGYRWALRTYERELPDVADWFNKIDKGVDALLTYCGDNGAISGTVTIDFSIRKRQLVIRHPEFGIVGYTDSDRSYIDYEG